DVLVTFAERSSRGVEGEARRHQRGETPAHGIARNRDETGDTSKAVTARSSSRGTLPTMLRTLMSFTDCLPACVCLRLSFISASISMPPFRPRVPEPPYFRHIPFA